MKYENVMSIAGESGGRKMMNCQPTLPNLDIGSVDDLTRRPELARGISSIPGLERVGELFSFEQTHATLQELLEIHEYERQRMGQDLHDCTGQLVVSLLLSLARLRKIGEDYGQGILIDEIQEIVRQIDKEIRSLAFLQYPAELCDRSLCDSIKSLALGFGRRTGMDVSFKSIGESSTVDEALSTALLRVTQEALVNVHRHAHAASAKVRLKTRSDRIELRISDDGVGMPDAVEGARPTGIGLQGMRYRVEAHGGRFEIRALKRGTMISATVPLARLS